VPSPKPEVGAEKSANIRYITTKGLAIIPYIPHVRSGAVRGIANKKITTIQFTILAAVD
jgi:hypothetical protein